MDLYVVIPRTDTTDPGLLQKCKKALSNQWSSLYEIHAIDVFGTDYMEAFNKSLDELTDKQGFVIFLLPWVILRDKALEKLPLTSDIYSSNSLLVFSYEMYSFNIPHVTEFAGESITVSDYALRLHDCPGESGYFAIWNKIFSLEVIRDSGVRFDRSLPELYDRAFVIDYLKACEAVTISADLIAAVYEQPPIGIKAMGRIAEKRSVFEKFYTLLKNNGFGDEADSIIDAEKEGYIVYEILRLGECDSSEKSDVKKALDGIRNSMSCAGVKTGVRINARIAKQKLAGIRNYWLKDIWRIRQSRKSERLKKREEFLQRNYHIIRTPIRKFHKIFVHDKYVLLYCESTTMKPHIMDYYSCVRTMDKVRFYIYYPDGWDGEVPDGARPVKSRLKALMMPWDLVVCADAKVPLYYNRDEAGIIYINHGLHMISYDEGETLYAYAEGNGRFSAMLEPNRRYADEMARQYPKDLIVHSGYKNADSIVRESHNKLLFRQQLGIAEDEKLIAVFGTWGPDSLFHRVGNALITGAEQLMKEGYRFILSIHPKEYARYDQTTEPLGEYIESLSSKGFIIRNPRESSIKYISAADVVICDYSTLCEEAMIAGKPVVLSDFPMERVWKESIIARYQKRGLVFGNGSNLRELIETALSDTDLQKFSTELVGDLMPPKQGYQEVIREVTANTLSDFRRYNEKESYNK
jgi:glycosyltransferase involved in cell wall biosynthesis